MTDVVTLAIIGIIPSTIAAVLSYLNGRKQADYHLESQEKLNTINETTNGKMETLLALTKKAEFAKGVLYQKENKDADKTS